MPCNQLRGRTRRIAESIGMGALAAALLLSATPVAAQQSTVEDMLGLPTADPAPSEPAAEDERAQRQQARRLKFMALQAASMTDEERRARAAATERVEAFGVVTGVGLAGVLGGLVTLLTSLGNGSTTGIISTDVGRVQAGLITGSLGGLTAIIGAIGLGVTLAERRGLDAAHELRLRRESVELSFDVHASPDGGALTVRGVF